MPLRLPRYASRRGKRTYSELVKDEFGVAGARVLQTSIIIHVAGTVVGRIQLGRCWQCAEKLPSCFAHHSISHINSALALALLVGVMIVYLIIIADMLVGAAPDWNGVLPTLLGRHDGVWYLSRPFVVRIQSGKCVNVAQPSG